VAEGAAALFGGTFDPIHNAHLKIARAAADRFGLARVLFVPAADPPHKPAGAAASWDDRVHMTELACAVDPRFEVSLVEAPDRANPAPSYSIVAIEKLKAQGYGQLSFLIGGDAFAEIRTWYRWRDVVAAVEFIVVTRPGSDGKRDVPPGAIVHELDGLELPISSSEVRRLLAEDGDSIPVPDVVLRYIRDHGLYRSQPR
jgi:nicotinate-nucleotide adenylyltransferase